MKIHEYQAKDIFKKYGLPIPNGIVAHNAHEAEEAAKELGTPVVVVKAQVHAGGRGKAGGVKVVKGVEEAYNAAEKILFSKLVTHQTGSEGKEVKKILKDNPTWAKK